MPDDQFHGGGKKRRSERKVGSSNTNTSHMDTKSIHNPLGKLLQLTLVMSPVPFVEIQTRPLVYDGGKQIIQKYTHLMTSFGVWV